MIVKVNKLKVLLGRLGWSNREFADNLGVELEEAEKMLAGEPVGYHTARRFIYWLKGVIAQHYIDWEAIGVENPLAKEPEVSPEESGDEGEDDDELDEDYDDSEFEEDYDDNDFYDYGTYYDEENWDAENVFLRDTFDEAYCERDSYDDYADDEDAYWRHLEDDNF